MSTGHDRSHNRAAPSLDDISPGIVPASNVTSSAAKDEVARAEAEARLIKAKSKAEQASMGAIGRFVGDVQRATLLGIMLLVFFALSILAFVAYKDQTHVPALVEVVKAIVFAGLGYLGARISAQDK